MALAASVFAASLGSIVQLEQQRSLGGGRLAADLHSPNRSVVQRAELAIGRTKQPQGVSLLEPLARSADPGTRALAVYGIGLIGTPSAAKSILHALNDTSDLVRASALDATARMEFAHAFDPGQESKALARTVALAMHAPNPEVAGRAAVTLQLFADAPHAGVAMNTLLGRLREENNAHVRRHIAWTLYRGYAARVPRNVFARWLKDPDDVVRIEAVRAIGKRGDKSLVPLLQPLRADPSWRVQEQTFESLKVLAGGAMTDHLKSLPPGLHLPPRVADPYAGIAALPRGPRVAKYHAPAASAIISQPAFSVNRLSDFTGPMAGPHPRMRLVTTQGNIYLVLYPEWAPLTVENFINLAQGGYYDNNPWFRIVPDFVVQSGDPSANAPGVGYTTVAEENPIEEDSYIIALGLDYTNPPNAHAKRDSAGSEFYITLSPQYHLNRDFSVFGRMIGGFDVLPRLVESDRILRVERIPDGSAL